MFRWTGGVVAILSAIFWWMSAVYQHTINHMVQNSMHGLGHHLDQHLNEMIRFGYNTNVAAAISAVIAATLIFAGNELQ